MMIFLLWFAAIFFSSCCCLSPLPRGISTYEVSGGSRPNAKREVRERALGALSQALADNLKLLEVEFPALLGEKTAYDDVDNVQILNANRDWAMETAAELAQSKELWVALPDRRELELAEDAWPGKVFKQATLTTIEDAAAALRGEEKVEQAWGAQFSRLVETALKKEFLGKKPDTQSAPAPDLILAVQPGDGGPLEDWLNLELLGPTADDMRKNASFALMVCNGAFDKLRGGYYPPILFPKLADCVDRFIDTFETIFYLKALNEKGRSGWIYRVYPENWQVIKQDRNDDVLVFESQHRPSYATAVEALLRGLPATADNPP